MAQIEAEDAKKEAQEALHNSFNFPQQQIFGTNSTNKANAMDRNRQLLEADGIKLLDNCEILTGLCGEDLR